ncbi:fimbrial protein [Bordetella genomosp. 9]|uniref:fimbrial protein n=1 Tax=Bordetella genomosp. 9 TaxID=1416803 RepID=UPI0012FC7EB0|nr:fimbrial protein [Bordetella genomosp. 9]
MPVPVFRARMRAALAAAVASVAPAMALGAPPAPYPSTDLAPAAYGGPSSYARGAGGLGVLAPALPMPVRLDEPVGVVAELPPCQPQEGLQTGEADAVSGPEPSPAAEPAPASGPADGTNPVPEGRDGAMPAAQGDCAAVPASADVATAGAIAPSLASLSYVPPPPGSGAPVKWGRPIGQRKPWFAGVSTQEGMVLGDRNLTYRNVDGPSVSVGSLTPFSPGWASAAPIGGVALSNLTSPSDATVPEGKLGYSSVWGRIDNTDPALTAGGVQTGPAAGTSALRYGLTPELTLEGQVQSARSLTATGLGTTYSLGQWGTLQGGAIQSRFDANEGWRYRLGYNVDLFDAFSLGYANELTTSGYGDLSTYEDGAAATRQWRNTFSAGVPVRGFGTVSGTYSGLRDARGELLESRYGLSQSMLLSPTVRLAVGADHDVVSGDYAVNMQLTMPIGAQ